MVSSVNVSKSDLVAFTEEIPNGKLHFLCIDTSMLSTVNTPIRTINNLNNKIKETNKRVFKWKMSFNPDPTKQG